MPIKEEEIKSFVSEYLDIDVEQVDDLESLKSKFANDYARKETFKNELAKDPNFVNPLIGKRLGSIETKLKQAAKDKLGLEFDAGEFKDKTIEDILELTTDKFKSKYSKDLDELKSKFTAEPSEITRELEEKLKLTKQEVESWKNEATKASQDFEQFKQTLAIESKQRQLKENLDKAFGSIKFSPEASELVIEGFKTKVLGEVKFDFDENNNFTTFDKEGKILFNPKKHGQPYSPEEYLKDKAIEYKVYQMNPHSKPTVPNSFTTPPVNNNNDNGGAKRMIHPSALV